MMGPAGHLRGPPVGMSEVRTELAHELHLGDLARLDRGVGVPESMETSMAFWADFGLLVG